MDTAMLRDELARLESEQEGLTSELEAAPRLAGLPRDSGACLRAAPLVSEATRTS